MKTEEEISVELNKILIAFDEHASLLKYAISKCEEWDYQTLAEGHTGFSEIKSMLISKADLSNYDNEYNILNNGLIEHIHKMEGQMPTAGSGTSEYNFNLGYTYALRKVLEFIDAGKKVHNAQ